MRPERCLAACPIASESSCAVCCDACELLAAHPCHAVGSRGLNDPARDCPVVVEQCMHSGSSYAGLYTPHDYPKLHE
eukprot:450963-Amphidinium_carterae.1